jgi:hypothetical protein
VTDEDLNTLRSLYHVFGTAYLGRTTLVFTHADLLDDALSLNSMSYVSGGGGNNGENMNLLPSQSTSPAAVGGVGVGARTNGVDLIEDKLHEYLRGSGEDIMQLLSNAAGGMIPINTMDREDRTSYNTIIDACIRVAGPFPKPRGKVARRLRQAALRENEYLRKQEMAKVDAKKKNDDGTDQDEGYGCILS